MKNVYLLPLLVLTLFAIGAAAQTTTEAAKSPAPAQDLGSTAASQSSPTAHVELFPTPEVPPDEAPKNSASTEDLATTPSQPPAASHIDLFPIIEVPPDELPRTTVSIDLSATSPSQPSSDSHVELFPIMEVPPDEVVKNPEPVQDFAASAPGEAVSASHVELFAVPDVPPEEVVPLTPAEIELQSQIQNAISKDPTVSGDNINVSLSAGGIELTGTVASVRARLAASRLAKSYAANRKVLDKMTIAAHRETPAEPSPAKADSPGTAHQNP